MKIFIAQLIRRLNFFFDALKRLFMLLPFILWHRNRNAMARAAFFLDDIISRPAATVSLACGPDHFVLEWPAASAMITVRAVHTFIFLYKSFVKKVDLRGNIFFTTVK